MFKLLKRKEFIPPVKETDNMEIVKFLDGRYGVRLKKKDSDGHYAFIDNDGATWVSSNLINRYCKFSSLKKAYNILVALSDCTGEPV